MFGLTEETSSGVCNINDCMMNMSNEHLPFGGVGASGLFYSLSSLISHLFSLLVIFCNVSLSITDPSLLTLFISLPSLLSSPLSPLLSPLFSLLSMLPGMGSYHGKQSFMTFSHRKSVLMKTNFLDMPLRYPPYGQRTVDVLKFVLQARPNWHFTALKVSAAIAVCVAVFSRFSLARVPQVSRL